MTTLQDKFHYVHSCDLDVNLQIKIGTLEGERDRPSYQELIDDPLLHYTGSCQQGCSDLYVTCQVFDDGTPLSLPTCTAHKTFSNRWNWNEWLTLPLKYSDLPRTAQLVFTVWDIYGPRDTKPVGGTTISLFGKHGTMRRGMHDLRVWPGAAGDGKRNTSTPGKTSPHHDTIARLTKLCKKHSEGHLTRLDWLDRLTFREIHMRQEQHKRLSNFLYLMIEFPHIHLEDIDYTVVYFEKGGEDVYHIRTYPEIVFVPDNEIEQENLVESKHHKLARSQRSGPTDRDLKPNAATRDQLNAIMNHPPTKTLTSEEKDLIWKFRFYLSSQKKALTKFLKSVNWNEVGEERQALDLLESWAPMDIDDALELLSPAFTHPAVRRYAVTRLAHARDQELLLYLLQLVQALRYEDFAQITADYEKEQHMNSSSNLLASPFPEQPFHQHEMLESTGPTSEELTSLTEDRPDDSPHQESMSDPQTLIDALDDPSHTPTHISLTTQSQMDLASFLIHRACNDSCLANYFYWYVRVECEGQEVTTVTDPRIPKMYQIVLHRFSNALANGGPKLRMRRTSIVKQEKFMEKLVKLVKMVARESANRKKKIEKLQELLQDPDALKFNFTHFDPIPLPVDPEVLVRGIDAKKALLFKSNLMPSLFTFHAIGGPGQYTTIFKHGDDLRQDQLIQQIITLMDRLLREENLDLKLMAYKVLATSSKDGFIQFVSSTAVAEIVDKDGSILNFLRKHSPSESGPLGVLPEVMDNYVKSCGKLFHVDFGYILGRDPKPMPPPMRLSREMVDTMGGLNSEHFADFRQLCYTAFLHLRRHANLILNLFSLMVDTNIPDIAIEPDKTVRKVQDKFRLDLTDEEAVHYMQNIIDISVSSTTAALMEQMHKIAQYWRK